VFIVFKKRCTSTLNYRKHVKRKITIVCLCKILNKQLFSPKQIDNGYKTIVNILICIINKE